MNRAGRLVALLGGPVAGSAAAGLAALSLMAGPVAAHPAQGGWTSPGADQPPATAQPELSGTVTHDDPFRPIRRVTFAVTATTEQPDGCGAPPTLPAWPGDDSTTVSWTFLPGPRPDKAPAGAVYHDDFVCNGTYELRATPQLSGVPGHDPAAPVTATLALAIPSAPPADVDGVLDVADGERAVTVSWSAPTPEPADLVAYVVERRIGDGDWEQVTATGGGDRTWVDSAPASVSGSFVYRVAAVRLGPSGGTNDLVASAPSAEVEVVVPEAAGAPVSSAGGNGGGRVPAAPRRVVASGGSVSDEIQRQAAAAIQSSAATASPPTTVDTGYKSKLDYGDRKRARRWVGGGGLLDDVLGETAAERRAILLPLGGALVLLMWFLHIRLVLRRAAQLHPLADPVADPIVGPSG